MAAPSEERLDACSSDQLIKIGAHYQIEVGDKRKKENMRSIIRANLYEQQVLTPPPKDDDVVVEEILPSVAGLTFEQQKELLNLKLQVQVQLKDKEVELKEKELEMERMRHRAEMARLDVETARLSLVRDGKLRDAKKEDSGDKDNILNSFRLVPKFNEKEVDVFFTLFERVADARNWSDLDRTVLLQCVLTGRAQEAFASLSKQDCTDYMVVKAAVLKAYELVPEAYRQRFRTWQRGNKSYLEFARDLTMHFNRWCVASGVENYGDLSDLIVLEQFKNSIPENVAVYICEQKAQTAAEAAALADDYALTHKSVAPDNRGYAGGSGGRVAGQVVGGKYVPGRANGAGSGPSGRAGGVQNPDNVCHYCHQPGHWKKECAMLESRNENTSNRPSPSAFAVSVSADWPSAEEVSSAFLPFVSKGHVSLIGNPEKVPVTILRDTGSCNSFILASVLPFSGATNTGSFIPVLGMEMSVFHCPVHKFMLCSDLFVGEVRMGVRPALPVNGVTIVLGNDVAGERVFAHRPMVQPIQTAVDVKCQHETDYLCNLPRSISQPELVREQKADPTLKELFNLVLPKSEVKNLAHGYFIEDGVLLRKCGPCGQGFIGDPVFQIVIPSKFQEVILRIAHYESGHMGVRRTYNRVLEKFFWPRVKRSVAEYIKNCPTCQRAGKQSQSVKVPALFPSLEFVCPCSCT